MLNKFVIKILRNKHSLFLKNQLSSIGNNSGENEMYGFGILLNPISLQQLDEFYIQNKGNIPRQSLILFLKIYAGTLKRASTEERKEFQQLSQLKNSSSTILKQILIDGHDSEYTAFLQLVKIYESIGFDINDLGVSQQDWYLFTYKLKQRIINMNYDLRSLIKILHFSQSQKGINYLRDVYYQIADHFQQEQRGIENYHIVRIFQNLHQLIFRQEVKKVIRTIIQSDLYYGLLNLQDKVQILISVYPLRNYKGYDFKIFISKIMKDIYANLNELSFHIYADLFKDLLFYQEFKDNDELTKIVPFLLNKFYDLDVKVFGKYQIYQQLSSLIIARKLLNKDLLEKDDLEAIYKKIESNVHQLTDDELMAMCLLNKKSRLLMLEDFKEEREKIKLILEDRLIQFYQNFGQFNLQDKLEHLKNLDIGLYSDRVQQLVLMHVEQLYLEDSKSFMNEINTLSIAFIFHKFSNNLLENFIKEQYEVTLSNPIFYILPSLSEEQQLWIYDVTYFTIQGALYLESFNLQNMNRVKYLPGKISSKFKIIKELYLTEHNYDKIGQILVDNLINSNFYYEFWQYLDAYLFFNPFICDNNLYYATKIRIIMHLAKQIIDVPTQQANNQILNLFYIFNQIKGNLNDQEDLIYQLIKNQVVLSPQEALLKVSYFSEYDINLPYFLVKHILKTFSNEQTILMSVFNKYPSLILDKEVFEQFKETLKEQRHFSKQDDVYFVENLLPYDNDKLKMYDKVYKSLEYDNNSFPLRTLLQDSIKSKDQIYMEKITDVGLMLMMDDSLSLRPLKTSIWQYQSNYLRETLETFIIRQVEKYLGDESRMSKAVYIYLSHINMEFPTSILKLHDQKIRENDDVCHYICQLFISTNQKIDHQIYQYMVIALQKSSRLNFLILAKILDYLTENPENKKEFQEIFQSLKFTEMNSTTERHIIYTYIVLKHEEFYLKNLQKIEQEYEKTHKFNDNKLEVILNTQFSNIVFRGVRILPKSDELKFIPIKIHQYSKYIDHIVQKIVQELSPGYQFYLYQSDQYQFLQMNGNFLNDLRVQNHINEEHFQLCLQALDQRKSEEIFNLQKDQEKMKKRQETRHNLMKDIDYYSDEKDSNFQFSLIQLINVKMFNLMMSGQRVQKSSKN